MKNIQEEFKKKFLKECRNKAINTEELYMVIDFVKNDQPTIFSDHLESSYLHNPQIKWSPGYFEECIIGVKDIFSIPRIKHLLEVRDFLRKRGDAGFKPIPIKTPGASTVMHAKFHPKENLKENFQTENFDLLRAQIALRLEIYDISNESTYLEQAIQWAEQKTKNIFLPYEVDIFKKSISEEKSDWTPDYFDIQTEYLSKNFSKERYLHLIKVRQYLRDHHVAGFAPPSQPTQAADVGSAAGQAARDAGINTPAEHLCSKSSTPGSMPRALRTALMLGGAIAALLALVLSMAR